MTDRVKVLFASDAGIETLWATPVAEGRYRIDNIPFSTASVSRGDLVLAHAQEGMLHFDALYEKSGERTLWISVKSGWAQATWLTELLMQLGCMYEAGTDTMLAVSVPPAVNLDTLTEELLSRDPADVSYDEGDPNPMHPLPAAPGSPAMAQLAALDKAVADEFQKLLDLAPKGGH